MLEYGLTACPAPVKAAAAFLLASACDGIADGITAAVIQVCACRHTEEPTPASMRRRACHPFLSCMLPFVRPNACSNRGSAVIVEPHACRPLGGE